MTISMDKKYRTRDGQPARVICTDRLANAPIVALVINKYDIEEVHVYNEDGKYYATCTDGRDLVEVSPYEDFKIDDPVLVGNDGNGPFFRRHFAGLHSSGRAQTFPEGKTSWSKDHNPVPWEYCRKPTPEEFQQMTKVITTD